MFSEKLVVRLKNATEVTVLTGAGISAESGVPTFRGEDGLWNKHQVEEIATYDAFLNNPRLFWDFYSWRRKLLKDVEPNLGHYALVDFERFYDHFTLITQNVDNLHKKAGNNKVIELHGNVLRTRCSKCNAPYEKEFYEANPIPMCEKCSGMTRPDVVLFGENLDENLLKNAQALSATSEVFFSIGTSGLVEPAASLPFLAKANGAYIVELNKDETPLSTHADSFIKGESGKILPQLVMIIERILS